MSVNLRPGHWGLWREFPIESETVIARRCLPGRQRKGLLYV